MTWDQRTQQHTSSEGSHFPETQEESDLDIRCPSCGVVRFRRLSKPGKRLYLACISCGSAFPVIVRDVTVSPENKTANPMDPRAGQWCLWRMKEFGSDIFVHEVVMVVAKEDDSRVWVVRKMKDGYKMEIVGEKYLTPLYNCTGFDYLP